MMQFNKNHGHKIVAIIEVLNLCYFQTLLPDIRIEGFLFWLGTQQRNEVV